MMWPRLQLACPAIRSGSVRMCVSGSDVNPYLVFSLKRQKKEMSFSSDECFHYFHYYVICNICCLNSQAASRQLSVSLRRAAQSRAGFLPEVRPTLATETMAPRRKHTHTRMHTHAHTHSSSHHGIQFLFDCAGPCLPTGHPCTLGAVPDGGFLGPGRKLRPLRVPSQGRRVAQRS